MDFKYLIDKVSEAQYGPGFAVLVCLTIVLVALTFCITVCSLYDTHVAFEKWKIEHKDK